MTSLITYEIRLRNQPSYDVVHVSRRVMTLASFYLKGWSPR
jgi:hypothetical protein